MTKLSSLRRRCGIPALAFLAMVAMGSAHALDDMNDYLAKAADDMVKTVAGRGYDLNSSFTEDLLYGKSTVRASNGGKTMCVAAVAEAMIRAIDRYARDIGSSSAFEKLPVTHWTSGKPTSLRAHLYSYKGVNSGGPGDAVTRLGIGEKLPFESLRPGDLLAFSRGKTGHSVVFLGYIDGHGNILSGYDGSSIAGFRYMSSQGRDLPPPYSGIGYRNAYFAGKKASPGCDRRQDDCGVLKISAYLNGGRLWVPERWDTEGAIKALREQYLVEARRSNPGVTKDALELAVTRLLERELPEEYSVDFE